MLNIIETKVDTIAYKCITELYGATDSINNPILPDTFLEFMEDYKKFRLYYKLKESEANSIIDKHCAPLRPRHRAYIMSMAYSYGPLTYK